MVIHLPNLRQNHHPDLEGLPWQEGLVALEKERKRGGERKEKMGGSKEKEGGKDRDGQSGVGRDGREEKGEAKEEQQERGRQMRERERERERENNKRYTETTITSYHINDIVVIKTTQQCTCKYS